MGSYQLKDVHKLRRYVSYAITKSFLTTLLSYGEQSSVYQPNKISVYSPTSPLHSFKDPPPCIFLVSLTLHAYTAWATCLKLLCAEAQQYDRGGCVPPDVVIRHVILIASLFCTHVLLTGIFFHVWAPKPPGLDGCPDCRLL